MIIKIVSAFANLKIVLIIMNMCFVFSNSVRTLMILKDNVNKSDTVYSFITAGQIWTRLLSHQDTFPTQHLCKPNHFVI